MHGSTLMSKFLFRPLKMERNFVFGCVLVFFCFVFHAKPGTINNDRTGLSDILYLSPFSRDLNHIKKFPKSFRSVEKNSFEILDFSSNFDRVSRLTLVYLCLI